MEYTRFLTMNDYYGVINKSHLGQISNNFDIEKFVTAEQNTETTIIEHLVENYQIDAALNVGRSIYEYNKLITYPRGVHFEYDEKIVTSLTDIQGVVVPEATPHWVVVTDLEDDEKGNILSYSQLKEYFPGDYVVYGEVYYECVISNGYSFENIRIPGFVSNWQLVNEADLTDEQKASTYEFDYDKNDYVVGDIVMSEDDYFEAVGDVNFVLPEYGSNIKRSDPRNLSLRNHMVRISLYELYKSISPNNISMTVMKDYEDSMKWLEKCNKMSINPGIPRNTKVNSVTGEETDVSVDWAMATFGAGSGVNDWMI